MKFNKGEKIWKKSLIYKGGITLIALIITIIVLLILAGVSINIVIGENGILSRAQKASDAHKEANSKERVLIELAGSYDISGKIDIELLNKNLRENLSGVIFNDEPISETNKIEYLPSWVVYDGVEVELTRKCCCS